jgi:hypothetical protein
MSNVWRLFFVVLLVAITVDASGQLKAKKIRKNNRRISNYKGTQSFSKHQQYQKIGIAVNAMNYFCEMAPASGFASTDIKFTRPGISIWGSHRFGPRWTAEAAYSWGTVRGSDYVAAEPKDNTAVYRHVRNLSFRNRISELSATVTADWFKNFATYISRVQLTPYAFAGVAVMYHNPQAQVNENSSLPEAGQWVKLKPLGTEGQTSEFYDKKEYSNIQIAIPLGIGVRYRLNQVLDVSFQFGIRYLFTDYIDDVSGNYVDLGALDSDLAREMSDRSRELTGGDNQPRDFTRIDEVTREQTYVSPYDGNTYTVFAGYGSDTHPDNIRGNIKNDDVLLYTQIRISYILGGSFMRAKYR